MRIRGVRVGSLYVGEGFDATDWGCLERDEPILPPHASPGRRSSRAIDHLAAHFHEGRSPLTILLNSVCRVPSRL